MPSSQDSAYPRLPSDNFFFCAAGASETSIHERAVQARPSYAYSIGTHPLVLGTRLPVLGTRLPVPGTRLPVLGTKYQVLARIEPHQGSILAVIEPYQGSIHSEPRRGSTKDKPRPNLVFVLRLVNYS